MKNNNEQKLFTFYKQLQHMRFCQKPASFERHENSNQRNENAESNILFSFDWLLFGSMRWVTKYFTMRMANWHWLITIESNLFFCILRSVFGFTSAYCSLRPSCNESHWFFVIYSFFNSLSIAGMIKRKIRILKSQNKQKKKIGICLYFHKIFLRFDCRMIRQSMHYELTYVIVFIALRTLVRVNIKFRVHIKAWNSTAPKTK